MKEFFLIIQKPGPSWKKGKDLFEQDLMEHGKYIHSLYQDGNLIEGGPFLDGSGGMALITAENIEQAQEIMEADPALSAGVLTAELHPWMRVDWDTYE